MTRLEGKKPNVGAIVIGAVIFALIAAGLFFAFRGVPEPTDAGLSSSENSSQSSANSASGNSAADGESANSLTTILTPLPEATPQETSLAPPTDSMSNAPTETPATSNAAGAPNVAGANETATNQTVANESAPAATSSVTVPTAP